MLKDTSKSMKDWHNKPIVSMQLMNLNEAYTIFRKDGKEILVLVSNSVILQGKNALSKSEIYYFESGQYNEVKDKN